MFDSKLLNVPEWAEKQIITRGRTAVEVLLELKSDFCLSHENIEAIIARVDKMKYSGTSKGRSMLAFLLASAYLFTRYPRAHRRPYNPRKFTDICCGKKFWITERELNRYVKLFRAEGLYPPDPTPLTLFRMYWPYVKVELELPEDLKGTVERILKLKRRYAGSPEVLIAGTIYVIGLVCGEPYRMTQEELSATFGITTVSIRNFVRRFEKDLTIEAVL